MSTLLFYRRSVLWLCALSLATLAFGYWTRTATPWGGDQGMTYSFGDSSGMLLAVRSVTGPAAAAGVRPGDRIDVRELPDLKHGDINIAPQRFHVLRNGQSIAIRLHPQPAGIDNAWLARLFSDIWTLLFAALIGWRVKSVRGSGLLALVLTIDVLGDALRNVVVPWVPAMVAIHLAGVLMMPLRYVLLTGYFVDFGDPSSARERWRSLVYMLSALTVIALFAYEGASLVHAIALQYVPAVFTAYEIALNGPTIPILMCGILAARSVPGADSQRVRSVVAAYAVLWFPWMLAGPFGQLFGETNDAILWNVVNAAHTLVPVILGYAALRKRLFDIGFIVNRAAVFAIISALVVGSFVILEWALGKWFESASHATGIAVNAGLALILGLSMRFVHNRVDTTVDRVFFRKRHDNELALRNFAREAAFITRRDVLLERTQATIETHSEAQAVRVALGDELDPNDPAVLSMRTWHEPAELTRYETALRGEYAFPMVAHGEFVGAIVCSEKSSGEAYAPDESDALKELAHGVGVALWALDLVDARAGGMQGTLQEILTVQQELLAEFRALTAREPRSGGATV